MAGGYMYDAKILQKIKQLKEIEKNNEGKRED
jgi:hypothetical protein